MATLGKEPVYVGDRVYDITHGKGTVVDTTFGEIAVRFDTGLRVSFDDTGHYAGIRRLFWHPPIVVEPPKDKHMWKTLAECTASIWDYLRHK